MYSQVRPDCDNVGGQIAGLHNFGRSCFLNTLLQALAACPQFIAWLQLHGAADKKSLIGSLLNTLEGEFVKYVS